MAEHENFSCVILAAGEGTRMHSSRPKVLFPICGRPMLEYILDAAWDLKPERIIVVVGHGREQVRNTIMEHWIDGHDKEGKIVFAVQDEQKGTGHALKCALQYVQDLAYTLVLYGDTPLVRSDTLNVFLDFHWKSGNDISILSTVMDDPGAYGRVVRDSNGGVREIVEARDLKPDQMDIKEVNSGIYLINNRFLPELLGSLKNDNAKKEYYLTDIVGFAVAKGLKVDSFVSTDKAVLQGINDRWALAEAEAFMRKSILKNMALSGVTVRDPGNTYVDWGVIVEKDAILEPFTILRGKTVVGEGAIIGPDTEIIDSRVGKGSKVWRSVVENSTVEDYAQIGPFSHIRPGSVICEKSLIGNFAEVKNSTIGRGTKVHHHSYIGDSWLGENVNIGAGTVTVNYDGIKKHRTCVEDGAFIGCNANLIAPVTIGKNSYVAAGSTVTDDVPPDSLAIARERQTNKEGWVLKKRRKNDQA